MGDSSSEDDYMSDKLLEKAKEVTRPGLPMKRTQQRQIQLCKRKATLDAVSRTKKLHLLEEDHRREGLSKPIDTSNKGFALLSAMGFKPGMKLGAVKTPSSSGISKNPHAETPKPSSDGPTSRVESAGLVEPISVVLKTDGRGGLGLAAQKEMHATARLRLHLDDLSKRGNPSVLTEEFRKGQRSLFELRAIKEDLGRSRRVCRQLDLEHGITKAENDLYWPPTESEVDEASPDDDRSPNDDEDSVPEDSVVLVDLTRHLRTKYYYCIWCGCRYRDADDLATECPGDTREMHDD